MCRGAVASDVSMTEGTAGWVGFVIGAANEAAQSGRRRHEGESGCWSHQFLIERSYGATAGHKCHHRAEQSIEID